MPFEPNRAVGYAPTLEEIMEDLGVDSPDDVRETVLSRCKKLYESAKEKGNLKKYGTPYEFIVCDSSEFYQTLVNLGHGNTSLVISDDLSPDFYFLMFADKIPEKLRKIAAAHESTEYSLFTKEGVEQGAAHIKACESEIRAAKKLGLKKDYITFLKKSYPTKLDELREQGLV